MKIPALRAKIGTWDYYITSLTFKQVSEHVSKIDEQLYTSKGIKDMLQRSINENYLSIKDYILKQPEMFFNSLVLAVYDDYPKWREIEFIYKKTETYQMGLLEFPTKHKIFPVDGQHRVEGIKEALKNNPDLENETIAAIFIGHQNTADGKKKTRRLFTTLNRYAKPVTTNDIIILDEDDSAAIVTRELLEEHPLFTGKRVINAKQKQIPPSEKDAITSIITLYQANVEIYKDFYFVKNKKTLNKNQLTEELKFHPKQDFFTEYKKYCVDFWNSLENITVISSYMKEVKNYAVKFRNNVDGGNLIFRPIGFLPLVKAAIAIHHNSKFTFFEIFKKFDKIDFNISSKPWVYVVWNPIEKKMIMNNSSLTELLLLYLFDKNILSTKDLKKLKESYASAMSIEDPTKINSILKSISN